jgi:cell fate (sporulation/competence/biofilm development) regulator YmcA (YheA/YmcA/DUF963 family)
MGDVFVDANTGLKITGSRTIGDILDDLKIKMSAVKGTGGGGKKFTAQEIDEIINNLGDSIKSHPLRQEYENAVKDLSNYEKTLRSQGLKEREIAKAMHQARRDLGVKYKDLTPDQLRDYIYEVNKNRYDGDPLGGSFEFFEEKYSGNYSKIIDGAKRSNSNVDNLLKDFKNYLKNLE